MWQTLLSGKLVNILTAVVSVVLLFFNVQAVDIGSDQFDPTNSDLLNTNPTFEDNFDGTSLYAGKWQSHNSDGLRKGGYWDINQCSVADGKLTITTEYKESGDFGPGWYTSGIRTKQGYTYGYYECSCILPKGQGLWSAFWLTCPGTSQVNNTGTKGAEIDIFESPYGYLNGEKSWKVTSNIHYNGYELKTRYKNVVISALENDPYKNFNTYGLLWTKDEYVFYINGHEVARTDYGGVSQVPEYAILSCEVDGAAATPTYGWSGRIDKNPEGKDFKAEFVVDYVKIYSLKNTEN